MKFQSLPINPALQSIIESILLIENEVPGVSYKNFPSANLTLVFNYGDEASQRVNGELSLAPKICLEGFRKDPVEYISLGKSRLIIVKLKPVAKALLSDLNGAFSIEGNWNLSEVYYQEMRQLSPKLSAAKTPGQRLALIERFIYQKIIAKPMNPYALAALHFIQQQAGQMSIRELATRIGYSNKQLKRIFIQNVGIAPKQFSQIVRLQHSLQLIRFSHMSLTQVALNSGFFDQAHFNKAFRQFTGMTPELFIATYRQTSQGYSPERMNHCQSYLTIPR